MLEGKIVGVCVSKKRGTFKENIGRGYLKKDYGLENDGHGGTVRQVSLLMAEKKTRLKSRAWGFCRKYFDRGN